MHGPGAFAGTMPAAIIIGAILALSGCGHSADQPGSGGQSSSSSANNNSPSPLPPADTTPPTIVSLSPGDGVNGVSLTASVVVVFSEVMSNKTLNSSSFNLTAALGGAAVPGTITVNGSSATFKPTSNLALNTTYIATITAGATDLAGNPLVSGATWSFTTAQDNTPPTITTVSPLAGSTNVALATTVPVFFSEAMKSSTLNSTNFTLAPTAGGANIAGIVTTTSNSATFTPSANLAPGTGYTATLSTGVQDANGNALAAPFSWNFSTVPANANAPTVTANSPLANATGVGLGAKVTVTFSQAMNNATLNTNNIKLVTSPGNVAVAGSISVSGNTATFSPSTSLAQNTAYTATVTTSVQDLAANSLQSAFSWSFSTSPPNTGTATVLWDPATVTNLAGYRVYYGNLPGVYLQTLGTGISVGSATTSLQISGLNSGVRYYFAVTSFNSSGTESGYSNEVFKDIP